jgi:transglutaminase-like putative cysteine protease
MNSTWPSESVPHGASDPAVTAPGSTEAMAGSLQGQSQSQNQSQGPSPAPSPSQSQSESFQAQSLGPPPTARPVELEVIHMTTYRYSSPVELAHHVAVLRPRGDGVQQLLSFDLHIEPAPPRPFSELDVYGNTRTLFSLTAAHDSLHVRATSRVRVLPAPVRPPAPPWEECRARWRYLSGQPLDAAVEFVFDSPLIARHASLRAWAEPSFPPGRALDVAATDLMHRLHEEFTYEPHSTHVGTPLLDAFEQRHGVCQDFAHIMIGALRSLGLAARYVSGYLLTEPPPGQPRLQGADASHAWVAVAWQGLRGGKAADTVWLELDPTNDCEAGTGHIRLAYGRDYADVTPLRGVIRGGGRHTLAVGVGTRVV